MSKTFIGIILLILLITFSSSAQIEVMSYNVKYANENDGENSWSKRKDHITNQLKFYEPDILGMQEVVLQQLLHFGEHLPQYKYVGVAREDGKQKGEYTAIFYDTIKFVQEESQTFWLSESPDKISVGWDAALPRICTWVRLKDRNTGKRFLVFNSHFDHIGEKARLESAKLILMKIKEVNSEDLPVILMGDFNLEPEAEGIKLLSRQMNDSKLVSSNVSFGPIGTFNGYKLDQSSTRRIDYIFTSVGNIEVIKYGVLTDSKDLKYPSDHFPVLVELTLPE